LKNKRQNYLNIFIVIISI